MKMYNGGGSCYKMSGNRRKPYIARVTIGWSDTGKQIYKIIGYFEKRQDGLKAIQKYLESPIDFVNSDLTLIQVYEMWSKEKFKEIGEAGKNNYIFAIKYLEPLYEKKFVDIKPQIYNELIMNINKSHSTRRLISVLVKQLLRFAYTNDIIGKDYSSAIKSGGNNDESIRTIFTKEEIDILWSVVDSEEIADTILILIYSGWRISELLELKTENINLDEDYMIGGKKTTAGTNRIVPIHPKIKPLIEKRYNKDNEYFLINSKGKPYNYSNYKREKFDRLMLRLDMKHNPHDTRHTFASMLDSAGANESAVQKIIGHSNYKTTRDIYIHKNLEELKNAINLI